MEARPTLLLLRTVVVIGLLFLALSAFGGTTDPSTPDSKYVEFGQSFPAIVRVKSLALSGTNEDKKDVSVQFGSGVIIRPNWLLTAGHVVHGTAVSVAVKDDKTEYPLDKVIVHKEFETGEFGFYDIALCYSAKDFKLDFYSPLYRDTNEVGKAVTISGYGLHGTFSTGATLSDGKKRAGHNKIDATERGILVCSPSVGAKRFPLEFMIAPGDSGGGMFIGNELAGINSFLMAKDRKPDGTYGDESAFTRVSLHVPWIEEQIALHELALVGKATTAPDITDLILIPPVPAKK